MGKARKKYGIDITKVGSAPQTAIYKGPMLEGPAVRNRRKNYEGFVPGVHHPEFYAGANQGWFEAGANAAMRTVVGELITGIIAGGAAIPDQLIFNPIMNAFRDGDYQFEGLYSGYIFDWREENIMEPLERTFPNRMRSTAVGFKPYNWRWWGEYGPSLASSISMAAPVIGWAKGLSALGRYLPKAVKTAQLVQKAKNLPQVLKIAGQSLGFGYAQRSIEGLMEATEMKRRMLQEGYDEETANKAAAKVMRDNKWLMFVDALQFGLLFRGGVDDALKGFISRRNDAVSKGFWLKEGLMQAPIEAGEEMSQFIMQEEARLVALGKARPGLMFAENWSDRLYNYVRDVEFWNSAFLGAVGGMIMPAAFSRAGKIVRGMSAFGEPNVAWKDKFKKGFGLGQYSKKAAKEKLYKALSQDLSKSQTQQESRRTFFATGVYYANQGRMGDFQKMLNDFIEEHRGDDNLKNAVKKAEDWQSWVGEFEVMHNRVYGRNDYIRGGEFEYVKDGHSELKLRHLGAEYDQMVLNEANEGLKKEFADIYNSLPEGMPAELEEAFRLGLVADIADYLLNDERIEQTRENLDEDQMRILEQLQKEYKQQYETAIAEAEKNGQDPTLIPENFHTSRKLDLDNLASQLLINEVNNRLNLEEIQVLTNPNNKEGQLKILGKINEINKKQDENYRTQLRSRIGTGLEVLDEDDNLFVVNPLNPDEVLDTEEKKRDQRFILEKKTKQPIEDYARNPMSQREIDEWSTQKKVSDARVNAIAKKIEDHGEGALSPEERLIYQAKKKDIDAIVGRNVMDNNGRGYSRKEIDRMFRDGWQVESDKAFVDNMIDEVVASNRKKLEADMQNIRENMIAPLEAEIEDLEEQMRNVPDRRRKENKQKYAELQEEVNQRKEEIDALNKQLEQIKILYDAQPELVRQLVDMANAKKNKNEDPDDNNPPTDPPPGNDDPYYPMYGRGLNENLMFRRLTGQHYDYQQKKITDNPNQRRYFNFVSKNKIAGQGYGIKLFTLLQANGEIYEPAYNAFLTEEEQKLFESDEQYRKRMEGAVFAVLVDKNQRPITWQDTPTGKQVATIDFANYGSISEALAAEGLFTMMPEHRMEYYSMIERRADSETTDFERLKQEMAAYNKYMNEKVIPSIHQSYKDATKGVYISVDGKTSGSMNTQEYDTERPVRDALFDPRNTRMRLVGIAGTNVIQTASGQPITMSPGTVAIDDIVSGNLVVGVRRTLNDEEADTIKALLKVALDNGFDYEVTVDGTKAKYRVSQLLARMMYFKKPATNKSVTAGNMYHRYNPKTKTMQVFVRNWQGENKFIDLSVLLNEGNDEALTAWIKSQPVQINYHSLNKKNTSIRVVWNSNMNKFEAQTFNTYNEMLTDPDLGMLTTKIGPASNDENVVQFWNSNIVYGNEIGIGNIPNANKNPVSYTSVENAVEPGEAPGALDPSDLTFSIFGTPQGGPVTQPTGKSTSQPNPAPGPEQIFGTPQGGTNPTSPEQIFGTSQGNANPFGTPEGGANPFGPRPGFNDVNGNKDTKGPSGIIGGKARTRYNFNPDYKREDFEEFKAYMRENLPQIPIETVTYLFENGMWAYFTNDGRILLDELAEYGSGYHEVFHAVTDYFLTESHVKRLYDEYRTYYANDETLTDRQADEGIAELFREFKISGGMMPRKAQKMKSTNKFFNWLLNLLENLFNRVTGKHREIERLFRKIDTGGFRNAKPIRIRRFRGRARSIEQRIRIGGITAEEETRLVGGVNVAFHKEIKDREWASMLLVGDLKGRHMKMIYDVIYNQLNNYLGMQEQRLLAQAKYIWGDKVQNLESDVIDPDAWYAELNQNDKYKSIFYSELGIYNKLAYVAERFYQNDTGLSVIEAHQNMLRAYKIEAVENELSEYNTKADPDNDWANVNIETDPRLSVSNMIRFYLSGVPVVEEIDGEIVPVLNEFGFQTMAPFNEVFAILRNNLAGSYSRQVMLDKMQELIFQYRDKYDMRGIVDDFFMNVNIDTIKNLGGSQFMRAQEFFKAMSGSSPIMFYKDLLNQGSGVRSININNINNGMMLRNEWESSYKPKDLPESYVNFYKEGKRLGDVKQLIDGLKKVGIDVSNVAKVTDPELIDNLIMRMNNILRGISTEETYNPFRSGARNDIVALANNEIKYGDYIKNDQVRNLRNKPIFPIQQYTHVTYVIDVLNDMDLKGFDAKMLKEHLTSVMPNLKLPYVNNSLVLQSVGENITGSLLEFGVILGHQSDNGAMVKEYGNYSNSERFMTEMMHLSKGLYHFMRAGDSSQERVFRFRGGNHFLSLQDFQIRDVVVNIFRNYLIDEIKTLHYMRYERPKLYENWKKVSQKINNNANIGEAGQYIGMIKNKDALINVIEKENIDGAIQAYFDSIHGEQALKDMSTWIRDTAQQKLLPMLELHHMFEEGMLSRAVREFANSESRLAAAQWLQMNYMISQTEQYKLFFGVPMVYGNPQTAQKRIAQGFGPKNISFVDNVILEYINEAAGAPAEKNKINGSLADNMHMNVAVVADHMSSFDFNGRVHRNDAIDMLAQIMAPRYGSYAQAKAELYKYIQSGDSHGWMTLPYYRMWSMIQADWDHNREMAYHWQMQKGYAGNKVVVPDNTIFKELLDEKGKGITITRDMVERDGSLLVQKKPQLYGFMEEVGFPVNYKLAMTPLLPEMLDSSPMLAEINAKMEKQGVALMVFESGSKLTNQVEKNGEVQSLWNPDGTIRKKDLTLQRVAYTMFGIQVYNAPKRKRKNAQGSQLQRHILSNLTHDTMGVDFVRGVMDPNYDSTVRKIAPFRKTEMPQDIKITVPRVYYNEKGILATKNEELDIRDVYKQATDFAEKLDRLKACLRS